MSIQTQTIEIYNESNPLEVSTVTVPVRRKQKIYSHEPYTLEAIKMYDKYCGDDIISNIMSYEGGNFRDVRVGVVSSFNSDKEIATIELSGMNLPIFVRRLSRSAPPCESCGPSLSASILIERNLYMWKGRPNRPTRSCLYIAGPPSSARTRM